LNDNSIQGHKSAVEHFINMQRETSKHIDTRFTIV